MLASWYKPCHRAYSNRLRWNLEAESSTRASRKSTRWTKTNDDMNDDDDATILLFDLSLFRSSSLPHNRARSYFTSVLSFFVFFVYIMSIKVWSHEERNAFFRWVRERERAYAIEQSQKKKTREICSFLSRVESIMRGQNAACDDAQIWVTSRRTRAREEEIHARAEMINR